MVLSLNITIIETSSFTQWKVGGSCSTVTPESNYQEWSFIDFICRLMTVKRNKLLQERLRHRGILGGKQKPRIRQRSITTGWIVRIISQISFFFDLTHSRPLFWGRTCFCSVARANNSIQIANLLPLEQIRSCTPVTVVGCHASATISAPF